MRVESNNTNIFNLSVQKNTNSRPIILYKNNLSHDVVTFTSRHDRKQGIFSSLFSAKNLKSEASDDKTIAELKNKIDDLTQEVEVLNGELAQKNIKLRNKEGIISSSKSSGVSYSDTILKPLNYDPLSPPRSNMKLPNRNYNAVFLYPSMSTKNANLKNVQPFTPPSIDKLQKTGFVSFIIPIRNFTKPAIAPNSLLNPSEIGERKTQFLRNYGECLNWSPQKVVRDIYQNFFDGHGGTLDGTSVQVSKRPNNRYNIKISGRGEYNHKEIEYIGGGSKSKNGDNAGNYGEGTKVFPLKMLTSYGVDKVDFSCQDWLFSYRMGNRFGSDRDIMYRNLSKRNEAIRGNYIEFETDNKELVAAILEGVNYLVHSSNGDMLEPTYENSKFGFKYLGKNAQNDKGNVYIANQRYEVKNVGKWNNNSFFVTFFTKTKPPAMIFDSGRDRTLVNSVEFGKLVSHYAKSMSDKELATSIYDLEELWPSAQQHNSKDIGMLSAENLEGNILLRNLLKEAAFRRIGLQFPPDKKYIAEIGNFSSDVKASLIKKGYTFCWREFADLGMTSAVAEWRESRNFVPLKPTPKQIARINILNQAVKEILQSIENSKNSFNTLPLKDWNKPIFIYDSVANNDKGVIAQAIIKNGGPPGEYLGFWVDTKYLDNASFAQMLGTALHEMCHRYGGDESAVFSYKLTDVLRDVNSAYINNPDLQKKMKNLQLLWDKT